MIKYKALHSSNEQVTIVLIRERKNELELEDVVWADHQAGTIFKDRFNPPAKG